MAIGRITGSMLHSNLVRNGVDLAFETNILYLDVTNSRVGIGTSSPSTALQVNGTTTTTGLVAGGLTYPTTDGSNGQVLTTNGSGTLSFTSLNSFAGITFVGDDSTGSTINTAETLKFTGSNNITTAVVNDTVTITGSKDINVNSISSGDSSAIQINDNVNVSGTFNAKTIVTNDLISEDSTAINVLDGMNVSGTLSADVLDVNEISSSDSSAIQVNDDLNASGTITAASFVTHGTSGNITGVNNIEVNQISSNDSTAIQINDAVNIAGDLSMNGNKITNLPTPLSNNEPATKLYVDSQFAAAGSGTVTSISAGTGLTASPSNPITTTGTISLDFSTVVARVVGDDSTGTDLRVGETIKIAGTSNISTAVSGDTLTITGPNLSGYLTSIPKDIDINSISSSDSSAIQINDAVNIVGTLSVSGNVISNVSDPVANQDAATKNYVDTQLSAVSTSFFVEDGTSTIATIDSGDTLRIIGSGGITTAVSGDTLTITGANQAQGITFFDDASTSTAIPDGGALQITSGAGIDTSIVGNVLTITNTSTQLEIDGGSAYSIYNAISEALIDGGTA